MVLLSQGTLKLQANTYQVTSYQTVPKKICTNFELHTNLCQVSAYPVVAPKVYQLCAAYRAAPAWIPEDPSTDLLSSLNVPLRLSHCRLEAAIGSGALKNGTLVTLLRRWREVFSLNKDIWDILRVELRMLAEANLGVCFISFANLLTFSIFPF